MSESAGKEGGGDQGEGEYLKNRVRGGVSSGEEDLLLRSKIEGLLERVIALAERGQCGLEVLSWVVWRGVKALLGIAEGTREGVGKASAGEVLGHLEAVLSKHTKTLGVVNKAYREVAERLSGVRRDIVVPAGVIGQIVQKELDLAEHYQKLLRVYRRLFGDELEKEISTLVPREYWGSEPLRDFCEQSEPAWWALLWPLIKKNNADFLVGVREGRFPTLGIRQEARWSKYRTEFRRHLFSLAKARG